MALSFPTQGQVQRLEDLHEVEHNSNNLGKQATPVAPRALLTASIEWGLDSGYGPQPITCLESQRTRPSNKISVKALIQ